MRVQSLKRLVLSGFLVVSCGQGNGPHGSTTSNTDGTGGDAVTSSGDGDATGGDDAGGGATGGDGNRDATGGDGAGGTADSGGTSSGGSDGGSTSGGAPGSGGVTNPFDAYPDWVFTCSLSRQNDDCPRCRDAKCVFCLHASPEERDEYNAEHEGYERCGTPNPVECSCELVGSECPPCAQQ